MRAALIDSGVVSEAVSAASCSGGNSERPTINRVGWKRRASSRAIAAVMPRAPPVIRTGSPGSKGGGASSAAGKGAAGAPR